MPGGPASLPRGHGKGPSRFSRLETLESFYANPARSGSREMRFGSGWRSRNYGFFEFTVFWIQNTRELCALRSPIRHVRSDGMFSRFFLGLPPHAEVQKLKDAELTVEVLGRLNEEHLLAVLSDWKDHQEDADGFEWIRSKVSATR